MPVMTGTDGNDTLNAAEGNETINGLGGNDYVYAIAGANFIDGGSGNDTIRGGWDADTLNGGDGDDVIYGDNGYTPVWTMPPQIGPDLVFGGAGNDTLYGGTGSAGDLAANDTLDGGDGNDFIDLGTGDDVVYGGSGDDLIRLSGGGSFTIDGGLGFDTLQAGGATVDLGAGTYSFANGVHGTLQGIEEVQGSSGTAEILIGDAGANFLNGGGGADTLIGGAGNDTLGGFGAAIIDGGDGDDVLSDAPSGPNDRITLEGGAGNDHLSLTFGSGVLHGDTGDDELRAVYANCTALFAGSRSQYTIEVRYDGTPIEPGDPGDGLASRTYLVVTDKVAGRDGTDKLFFMSQLQFSDGLVSVSELVPYSGTSSNDSYVGTSASEVMTGFDGDDSIYGGAGDDSISGGGGNDTIDGGPGIDTVSYEYSGRSVEVSLAITSPQPTTGEGTDKLSNIENLIGSTEPDILTGNSGANYIDGGGSGDSIGGGAGNDTLFGSYGNDTLNGGDGIDVALYRESRSDVVISHNGTTFAVTSNNEGADFLSGIERLQFDDVDVALDINGNAGMAYRLYQAAFNRKPDIGGLGYQMHDLDIGVTLEQVASNFIVSPEFQRTYGNVDNTQFLTLLYNNVLHRDPDEGGLQFHLDEFARGQSRATMLIHFSESPENQANVIGDIANGMTYTF
jgi:Ca2+-binding RTX toxin-like protein